MFLVIISFIMLFLITFLTVITVVVKLRQVQKIENSYSPKIISMNKYIMSQNSTSDIEEIDDAHLMKKDEEGEEDSHYSLIRKGYCFIQNFKEYGDLHKYEPFMDDLNKLIYRKNQKGYEILKIYIKCFNKFSSILEDELPKIFTGQLPIDLTNKKVLCHLGGLFKATELVEEGLNYIMEDQHTNFTYNFKMVSSGINYFFNNAPTIYLIIAQKYSDKNVPGWSCNHKLQKILDINNQVSKKVVDYRKVGNEFFSIISDI